MACFPLPPKMMTRQGASLGRHHTNCHHYRLVLRLVETPPTEKTPFWCYRLKEDMNVTFANKIRLIRLSLGMEQTLKIDQIRFEWADDHTYWIPVSSTPKAKPKRNVNLSDYFHPNWVPAVLLKHLIHKQSALAPASGSTHRPRLKKLLKLQQLLHLSLQSTNHGLVLWHPVETFASWLSRIQATVGSSEEPFVFHILLSDNKPPMAPAPSRSLAPPSLARELPVAAVTQSREPAVAAATQSREPAVVAAPVEPLVETKEAEAAVRLDLQLIADQDTATVLQCLTKHTSDLVTDIAYAMRQTLSSSQYHPTKPAADKHQQTAIANILCHPLYLHQAVLTTLQYQMADTATRATLQQLTVPGTVRLQFSVVHPLQSEPYLYDVYVALRTATTVSNQLLTNLDMRQRCHMPPHSRWFQQAIVMTSQPHIVEVRVYQQWFSSVQTLVDAFPHWKSQLIDALLTDGKEDAEWSFLVQNMDWQQVFQEQAKLEINSNPLFQETACHGLCVTLRSQLQARTVVVRILPE